MRTTLALLLAGTAFFAGPSFAHHSAVMFDDTKEVTLTGTVKEFQYTNPHSWLLVDVKNDDGSVTTWGFEAEGPSTLMRAGIRKSDFSPGTEITIAQVAAGEQAGEFPFTSESAARASRGRSPSLARGEAVAVSGIRFRRARRDGRHPPFPARRLARLSAEPADPAAA